ncbi:MAG: Pyruvate kinase [Candidatus Moranbacteria bacterium GW2011_GWC2_45_10]|nr:MAG: Pyruvate kinase [Candidatus Moranbacteria bacterium GW2011_GWC2_45_10]
MKRTKIVATIGLASEDKEILRKLIEAGMNVARLNFSHGTHEWHGNVIKRVRELSKEMGVPVGILADLQGPRIRTLVEAEVEIKTGEKISVSDVAKNKLIEKGFLLDVPNIVDDIEVGNEILVEDGIMKVVVREKNDGELLCSEHP